MASFHAMARFISKVWLKLIKSIVNSMEWNSIVSTASGSTNVSAHKSVTSVLQFEILFKQFLTCYSIFWACWIILNGWESI